MTPIAEQRLRFVFGPSWQVVKYDDHPAYREGIERLKGPMLCREDCPGPISCKTCGKEPEIGARAVDIVGRCNDELYLIEVKDFRGHEVENRRRIKSGDLAIEVALKVKDTLAGLVGGMHRREDPRFQGLRDLVEPVLRRPPTVILWLEEDIAPKKIEERGLPTFGVGDQLRKRLGWLSRQVQVVNTKKARPAPDLEVQTLSSRVYELRRIMKKQASISRDDFCQVWSTTPQAAGEQLKQLCDQTIVARAPGKKEERYKAGPRWDWLQDG